MSNDPKQEKREIAGRAKMLKFEGETEQVRRLAEDVLTLLGRVDEAEAKVTGWVSPEEAKAREDAARREALLEAATAAEEQWRFWWGGDASWMTTATHVTGLMADALRNRAATERGEEQA